MGAALLWRRSGVHAPASGPTARLDAVALAEQAVVAVVAAVVMVSPMLVDGTLLYGGLQQDNLHYTRLAAFVSDLGAECPTANRLLGATCRRGPYHFLDIWTAALFGRLGLPLALAFSGAAAAVLTSSLHGACRGLAARLGAGRLSGLVALGALLSMPESWLRLWPVRFLSGTEIFSSHLLFANKMLPASVLLVLAAWAWVTPAVALTPLLLASAGVVHATMAPFAGVTVALLLAHDLWRGERDRARAGLVAVGMLGAMGLWLLVEGRLDPASGVPLTSTLPGYVGSGLYLRTVVNVVGKTVLQLVMVLVPYALLGGLFWSRAATLDWLRSYQARLGLGLLGVGLAVSLGLWAIIHQYGDSVQVFANLSTALFPLLTVAVLSRALEPGALRRVPGRLALGLSLVAGVAGTFVIFSGRRANLHASPSPSFRAQAASLLAGTPGLGARFIEASTMTTVFTKNISLGSPEYLLAAAPSGYEVVIPVGEIPFPSDPIQRAMSLSVVRMAPFPEFAERETRTLQGDPATIRRFMATLPFDHVVCEGASVQSYCQREVCENYTGANLCHMVNLDRCIEDGSFRLCRTAP